MARPTPSIASRTGGVGLRRSPPDRRRIHSVERTSSAVSNTAGMTVEKEREVSKKYVSPPNLSPPRYSQFWVRRLKASNSHHAGAEHANRRAKSFGEQIGRASCRE